MKHENCPICGEFTQRNMEQIWCKAPSCDWGTMVFPLEETQEVKAVENPLNSQSQQRVQDALGDIGYTPLFRNLVHDEANLSPTEREADYKYEDQTLQNLGSELAEEAGPYLEEEEKALMNPSSVPPTPPTYARGRESTPARRRIIGEGRGPGESEETYQDRYRDQPIEIYLDEDLDLDGKAIPLNSQSANRLEQNVDNEGDFRSAYDDLSPTEQQAFDKWTTDVERIREDEKSIPEEVDVLPGEYVMGSSQDNRVSGKKTPNNMTKARHVSDSPDAVMYPDEPGEEETKSIPEQARHRVRNRPLVNVEIGDSGVVRPEIPGGNVVPGETLHDPNGDLPSMIASTRPKMTRRGYAQIDVQESKESSPNSPEEVELNKQPLLEEEKSLDELTGNQPGDTDKDLEQNPAPPTPNKSIKSQKDEETWQDHNVRRLRDNANRGDFGAQAIARGANYLEEHGTTHNEHLDNVYRLIYQEHLNNNKTPNPAPNQPQKALSSLAETSGGALVGPGSQPMISRAKRKSLVIPRIKKKSFRDERKISREYAVNSGQGRSSRLTDYDSVSSVFEQPSDEEVYQNPDDTMREGTYDPEANPAPPNKGIKSQVDNEKLARETDQIKLGDGSWVDNPVVHENNNIERGDQGWDEELRRHAGRLQMQHGTTPKEIKSQVDDVKRTISQQLGATELQGGHQEHPVIEKHRTRLTPEEDDAIYKDENEPHGGEAADKGIKSLRAKYKADPSKGNASRGIFGREISVSRTPDGTPTVTDTIDGNQVPLETDEGGYDDYSRIIKERAKISHDRDLQRRFQEEDNKEIKSGPRSSHEYEDMEPERDNQGNVVNDAYIRNSARLERNNRRYHGDPPVNQYGETPEASGKPINDKLPPRQEEKDLISKIRRVKSLLNTNIKGGYSGRMTDALGRVMCFQAGRHVPCKDPKEPEKRPIRKAKIPPRPTIMEEEIPEEMPSGGGYSAPIPGQEPRPGASPDSHFQPDIQGASTSMGVVASLKLGTLDHIIGYGDLMEDGTIQWDGNLDAIELILSSLDPSLQGEALFNFLINDSIDRWWAAPNEENDG